MEGRKRAPGRVAVLVVDDGGGARRRGKTEEYDIGLAVESS